MWLDMPWPQNNAVLVAAGAVHGPGGLLGS